METISPRGWDNPLLPVDPASVRPMVGVLVAGRAPIPPGRRDRRERVRPSAARPRHRPHGHARPVDLGRRPRERAAGIAPGGSRPELPELPRPPPRRRYLEVGLGTAGFDALERLLREVRLAPRRLRQHVRVVASRSVRLHATSDRRAAGAGSPGQRRQLLRPHRHPEGHERDGGRAGRPVPVRPCRDPRWCGARRAGSRARRRGRRGGPADLAGDRRRPADGRPGADAARGRHGGGGRGDDDRRRDRPLAPLPDRTGAPVRAVDRSARRLARASGSRRWPSSPRCSRRRGSRRGGGWHVATPCRAHRRTRGPGQHARVSLRRCSSARGLRWNPAGAGVRCRCAPRSSARSPE